MCACVYLYNIMCKHEPNCVNLLDIYKALLHLKFHQRICPAHPPVCWVYVSQSICQSARQSVRLSIRLSVILSVRWPVRQPVCLSLHLSVCQCESVRPSVTYVFTRSPITSLCLDAMMADVSSRSVNTAFSLLDIGLAMEQVTLLLVGIHEYFFFFCRRIQHRILNITYKLPNVGR